MREERRNVGSLKVSFAQSKVIITEDISLFRCENNNKGAFPNMGTSEE